MQEMILIEILLPLKDNAGKPFDRKVFDALRRDLTDIVGGVTAFTRAPALGETRSGGKTVQDDIILLEVMTDEIDDEWWKRYRQSLEDIFEQDEIIIRALPMKKI